MFCDRYFYDNTFVTQVIDIFLLKIVIQDLYRVRETLKGAEFV